MGNKQLTDLEIAIKLEEIEREEYQQELHICKYCGDETTQPDDECYMSMSRLKQETLTYSEAAKKEERIFNSNMLIKETLEEVAENEASIFYEKGTIEWNKYRQVFELGAKWQAERMYSEEDVYHILCEHTAFLFMGGKSTLTEWFEQYKKK